GGLTWSAPVAFPPASIGDDRLRIVDQLVTDRNGTWLAVGWSYVPDVEVVPRVASSIDDGVTWSSPEPLDPGQSHPSRERAARVATDGAGLWIAAWATSWPSDSSSGVFVARGAVCGDRARGAGEACDGDVGADAGCCSATCGFAPSGTSCSI